MSNVQAFLTSVHKVGTNVREAKSGRPISATGQRPSTSPNHACVHKVKLPPHANKHKSEIKTEKWHQCLASARQRCCRSVWRWPPSCIGEPAGSAMPNRPVPRPAESGRPASSWTWHSSTGLTDLAATPRPSIFCRLGAVHLRLSRHFGSWDATRTAISTGAARNK